VATTSDKTPNWDSLLELYAEGASDVEIAHALHITVARFYNLIEEVPSFSNFVERGRTLAQSWWYAQGRKNLWNKEFNTTLYNFQMKNRFGWADKVETAGKDDKPVDQQQAKAALVQALRELGKKNPELLSGANLSIVKKNDHD
jgi:hypothetical protein